MEGIASIKRKCKKEKHKLRTNAFGVTWCVGCGLLSNKIASKLKDSDKIVVKWYPMPDDE